MLTYMYHNLYFRQKIEREAYGNFRSDFENTMRIIFCLYSAQCSVLESAAFFIRICWPINTLIASKTRRLIESFGYCYHFYAAAGTVGTLLILDPLPNMLFVTHSRFAPPLHIWIWSPNVSLNITALQQITFRKSSLSNFFKYMNKYI
jgi:hypothetical protein